VHVGYHRRRYIFYFVHMIRTGTHNFLRPVPIKAWLFAAAKFSLSDKNKVTDFEVRRDGGGLILLLPCRRTVRVSKSFGPFVYFINSQAQLLNFKKLLSLNIVQGQSHIRIRRD
jgi:hypothetical protein